MKLNQRIMVAIITVIIGLMSITIGAVYYFNKESALERGSADNKVKALLAEEIVNKDLKSILTIINSFKFNDENYSVE